ncbi:MAG: HDOD domain-containing protein [Dechloromonas sp.]|nr:HDOD domain-containing protein [Dechloromonas sp.]
MNRIDALAHISNQVQRGELNFSTGLGVSFNIYRALDQPDCHIDRAAQLLRGEPLISARIVAIANSAIYNRGGQNITDLRNALSRIGLKTARTLTMAVATRQLAGQPNDPALRAAASQLWEHTAHVAALAHVIARRVTHLDAETALFAGIIHEMAGFYLISRASDFPGLLDGDPGDWTERVEPEISRTLFNRLSIPETVSAAVAATWEGLLAFPPTSLGDTLLLANELSPTPSPLYTSREIAHSTPEIDAVINHETLSQILEEAAQEVASLTEALRF